MAKFRVKKAKTARERLGIVAEEKRKLKMNKKMEEQQREKHKTDAAKKKEAIKAQVKANRVERELKKKEELKAKQAVERELKKSAKKVVEKAVEKELKKSATAAKMCTSAPVKRRGRPSKNLAAAMAEADSAAIVSAKKVQIISVAVTIGLL